MNKLWSVLLVFAMALGTQDVWAKRMGGGMSFGDFLDSRQSVPSPRIRDLVERSRSPARAGAPCPEAADRRRDPVGHDRLVGRHVHERAGLVDCQRIAALHRR